MRKKSMTSGNVSVVKFENNKIPVFKEEKSKDWISCGEKNDYPDYLINLCNRSAKHNAIISGKTHYVKGNGLKFDKSTMNAEQEAKFAFWLKNLSSCSTDHLLEKVIIDLLVFNGLYLEAIPNMAKNGIGQFNHIGYEKIRIGKNEDSYYYSRDWTTYNQTKEATGFTRLEPYDPKTFSGIIRYKGYRPGNLAYPLPEYIGCIQYIEVDGEIGNFHLNNIKNGFVGGTMISFNNGSPTPEEQKLIEKKLKGKFTGTDKAGQIMISFSDNKETAPTVIPLLQNDFSKMFGELNETSTQEIFTGHKITSLGLFGIKESKGLGSKDELRDAYELFQNGYVNNKQNIIAEIFNDAAEASGYGRVLYIEPIEPIKDSLSQTDIVKVMTNDEIRAQAGLEAISNRDENQKIVDALNSLSPIIANKVLEAMSEDEIRSLVSLGKKLNPTSAPAMMSLQFHNVDNFKVLGRQKSDFRILSSSEVDHKEDVKLKELQFFKEGFLDVENVQSRILDLVKGNPGITPEEIARALNEGVEVVKKQMSELIDRQLLNGKIGNLNLSPEAKTITEKQPAEPSKLEILYSYELRKNLPPLQTESRDFCQELIDLDRLYSREEIENISKIEGRDVWSTRGGYFHNTKLNQTTPYCRHVWMQNVVRRK